MENSTQPEQVQEMLDRLIAMARRYLKEGNNQQAADILWMLVTDQSQAHQAEVAKEELMALAEHYERAGTPHLARSIYERLMALKD
jgi:hypothetical protein